MKLHEINDVLRQVLDEAHAIAEENDGVIPDSLYDHIAELEQTFEGKMLDIAKYVKGLEADAEAISTRAKQMYQRANSSKMYAEKLRKYLAGLVPVGQKYSDDEAAIGWRKSSGVVVSDESILPEQFWNITREVSKSKIKDAITKESLFVPGAHIEERQNVVIK